MLYRRSSGWKRSSRVMTASLAGALALSVAATAAQDTSSDTVRPASIHLGSCDAPGETVAELNDLVVMFDDNDDDQGGGDDADDGLGGDDNADDGVGSDDNADDGTDDADDGTDDADDADDDSGFRPGIRAFQANGSGFVGPEDASVVEGSEDSTIGTDLATLLAEPHVVAVFESDGSDTIIACGSIGGFTAADDDTDLAVGLREQNDSGFAGIALFDDDDDDNELDVDVYIGRDVAGN